MSKIITYNKLVRDNIPEIIEKNGGKPKYRVIEDNIEYIKLLKQKLIEEMDEFFNAKTEEDAIEELADIFTVIWFLDVMFGSKVKEVVIQKGREKGYFLNRIFLESVEVEEDLDEEGT